VTFCTGATPGHGHVFDPWVSFAPDGGLYVSCVVGQPEVFNPAVLVSKSTDGGLHWNDPVALFATTL
jgi:hypothetical protein